MTRSQVRFLLGTPLVVDVFRNDRWDYVYFLRRQGQPPQQRAPQRYWRVAHTR
jgi:outer membrane protein assembly factor BamE